jgi:hypothetical protein
MDEEIPRYMVPNPLISINYDFLKDCTIPSFAFTNLKTILIPSSSKLPIPISNKYYKMDFIYVIYKSIKLLEVKYYTSKSFTN